VRRFPLLVSGLLMLPLVALPAATASAGVVDGGNEPAPSVTVTEEPAPDPSETAEPEPEPSVTDEPEEPGEPGEPGDEFLSGTLTRSPASGPAGTSVTVASVDECVDGEGNVGAVADVLALNLGNLDELDGLSDLARIAASDEDDFDFEFVEKVVDTDDAGAWKTALKIPGSSEPGDVYAVIAACFADEAEVTDPEALPFLVYEPLDFTVTGAPEAPVAEPVPGDPSFTG
jgi:hypothetical protein